eukprot:scaffold38238_cov172-Skeletonema_dohrnii-CCMP3373.AAC.1
MLHLFKVRVSTTFTKKFKFNTDAAYQLRISAASSFLRQIAAVGQGSRQRGEKSTCSTKLAQERWRVGAQYF